MQLHFSPSMRSITISSSGNGSSNGGFGGGGGDLMKIKVAPRHISYRTLFHTILILAFLLPFVFILTALVTLEGVNKCSSIGTLLYFHSFLFILNHYMGVLILYFIFFFLSICVDPRSNSIFYVRFFSLFANSRYIWLWLIGKHFLLYMDLFCIW